MFGPERVKFGSTNRFQHPNVMNRFIPGVIGGRTIRLSLSRLRVLLIDFFLETEVLLPGLKLRVCLTDERLRLNADLDD